MPTTIEIAETETWKRIENTPQWAALTEAQKIFVVMFLATGGSALAAVKAGYRPSSEHNLRTMSYELSKNRRITAVLDMASGEVRSERDQLITEVRKQIRRAEPGSVAASRLCSQLGGLLNLRVPEAAEAVADEPTKEPAPQKFSVGEIVLQNGAKFKVTAVDGDGKILTASEIEE